MNKEQLNKIFKLTHIGRIADTNVDPITDMYNFQDVKALFERDPNISSIPVELPEGYALVHRDEIIITQKGIFSDNSLEKYLDRDPFYFKANDNVYDVLNKIITHSDPQKNNDFIVYYKKSYFGVGRFRDLVQYATELTSIDENNARDLQQFLIEKSSFHNIPVNINAYNKMASNLGGDFYRVTKINPELSLVSIFDVSGKGITGALSTISISAFFSLYFARRENITPTDVVADLNKYIYDQTPFEIFITAILMFVDYKNHELIIYNLGHTKILRYNVGLGEDFSEEIDSKLPPLGIDEDLSDLEKYKMILPIKSNLKLVFYSDGLSEASNDYGIMYGEERIKKIFDENISLPNKEVIDNLNSDLQGFLEDAPLSDDITVILSDFSPYSSGIIEEDHNLDLNSIKFLFHRDFDYSIKLYLNCTVENETTIRNCKLYYSTADSKFLIVSKDPDSTISGYLIDFEGAHYFHGNDPVKSVKIDEGIYDSLLTPQLIRFNWFFDQFHSGRQKASTKEGLPTIEINCTTKLDYAPYETIDLLINETHSLPFRMEFQKEGVTTRITSKKWVHYGEEFVAKEYSLYKSDIPSNRTKVYMSDIKKMNAGAELFDKSNLGKKDYSSLVG
jgi:sigma-B regulation protein RsbU (phosphoserine phosphatase)